jgi:hypothetical protein
MAYSRFLMSSLKEIEGRKFPLKGFSSLFTKERKCSPLLLATFKGDKALSKILWWRRIKFYF